MKKLATDQRAMCLLTSGALYEGWADQLAQWLRVIDEVERLKTIIAKLGADFPWGPYSPEEQELVRLIVAEKESEQ